MKQSKKLTADNYENVIDGEGSMFDDKQIKNIQKIVGKILPELSGLYGSCASGGGFEHIFLQLKDGRWLGFHNGAGEVTVSEKFENFDELYEAFWEQQEKVTNKYVKYFTTEKSQEQDDFRAVDTITKQIIKKDFVTPAGLKKEGGKAGKPDKSEAKLWKLIEDADWQKDHDYKRIAEVYNKLDKETFDALQNFYNKLMKDLNDRFEKDWLAKEIPVSDDGWSDLRAEVIGRGKKFYKSVTAKKLRDIAKAGGFYQNFGYSFTQPQAKNNTISTKSIERCYTLGFIPPQFSLKLVTGKFPDYTIGVITDADTGTPVWYDARDKENTVVAFSTKLEKVLSFIQPGLSGIPLYEKMEEIKGSASKEIHNQVGEIPEWKDVFDKKIKAPEKVRIGEKIYVLINEYSDRSMAEKSLEDFPPSTDNKILPLGADNNAVYIREDQHKIFATGGSITSRYQPKEVNGEWQIDDTSNKVTLQAKFIDPGLPKPPYETQSEAESVAFAMNQNLGRDMLNWGKDGGKPKDFEKQQSERDKQYHKDSKRFKKFVEELEKLSVKYGFVIHITGGVRYRPNVTLDGIVYSNDLSSADIIPAIVKWGDGETENNTRLEHGGKIKRSDFELGEAIRLIKLAEDGNQEQAEKQLQHYIKLYTDEKNEGNTHARFGRSLDSIIEEYQNAVAYVREIPKKHNCDNALNKMLEDLSSTTDTFVSSKEKRGAETPYAQRLLGKINALRTYIKAINPNQDLSAYDFIDQF